MPVMINPFDTGGYTLAEMTEAINILPNIYTRLGEMGLFRFEGVTQRSVIIEQAEGVLNLLPTVPLGGPATVANRDTRSMRSFTVPWIPHDVVMLDDAITPMRIASTELNLAYNWRIGPASKDPADPTYVQLAFMPKGIGRRPYSVAHVSQPWKFARTPGDLTISWKRRTRAVAGDSWEAIEVPLFEESESYEVDILDGATIKRTLASIMASVVYTGAQQIADWGALLVPGNSLQVAIYQLSAQFGRGARKLETLYF